MTNRIRSFDAYRARVLGLADAIEVESPGPGSVARGGPTVTGARASLVLALIRCDQLPEVTACRNGCS